jgi:hypothetical protein
VGALWGCTNPLLKKGRTNTFVDRFCWCFFLIGFISIGTQEMPAIKRETALQQFLAQMYYTLMNWKVSESRESSARCCTCSLFFFDWKSLLFRLH